MCILGHLLFLPPIWVFGFSFFSISSTSQEIPISPGPPIVNKVVLRQDLNKKILIALVVSSTLLCLTLLLLLYLFLWRYRYIKNSFTGINPNHPTDSVKSGVSTKPIVHKIDSVVKKGSIPLYEYQLLETATNKFSESHVLSRGGRGCLLYRACLDEKSSVTVKKLDVDCGDTEDIIEKQFENEVDWLAKIKHQNIISMLGFCVYRQTRCIVYETMQNGSLESQLHEYLHEHCHPPLVHRDLKSSNILLDSHYNAKISDFGYATVLMTQSKNLKLTGTLGNRASHYLLDGKVTEKNDVYSFGVILLELLLGKKPSAEPESIVTWVPKLSDRANLPNILDPVIKGSMDLKHLYQVAAVAVLCVQPEPSYRPLITDVLHSLIPLLPLELGGSLRIL
ncbi:unnamed protein product [Eruca vesicaria subsp. sativa]|uniref:Protein kinase domain-containing protein n=1 Tax=Eruca vesicaria subsp. sativa TaxID=29727 RepID=A0ABC8JQB5_ERUVS|nr:unnamed protein product [Eruca vesicaria subsp. sativa]